MCIFYNCFYISNMHRAEMEISAPLLKPKIQLNYSIKMCNGTLILSVCRSPYVSVAELCLSYFHTSHLNVSRFSKADEPPSAILNF